MERHVTFTALKMPPCRLQMCTGRVKKFGIHLLVSPGSPPFRGLNRTAAPDAVLQRGRRWQGVSHQKCIEDQRNAWTVKKEPVLRLLPDTKPRYTKTPPAS